MKLLTQQFLESHSLDELTASYGISVKRHGVYPNLVFLKYSQLDSPMGEPIVQECRGLILDEADNWRVISFPFRKFFNHGEGHAAQVDWKTVGVYEKLDGSLMTLYWYDNRWHVASNGLPDASGEVYGHCGTFADLFWVTWKNLGLKLPDAPGVNGAKPSCFMFELMTPYNRVVVPHSECRIVCLGGRFLDSFDEMTQFFLGGVYDWPLVQCFPLRTVDEVVDSSLALKPMECEGYVVCDSRFNRVKVKSPQYVALAHMKDQFSARRMLDVVRLNESDEFLTYFPEMRPLYEDVRSRFAELCRGVEQDYERLKDIPIQKDFAIEALKTRCSGALFAIRGKKVQSAREYLSSITQKAVEGLLNLDPLSGVYKT